MKRQASSKVDSWQRFLELFSMIHSTEELKEFFNLLFTIEEKETLASRFLIIKALLDNKLTQREIAKKYKVSIAQITRGSNALKIIEPKLRRFLEEQFKKMN
jgi:TrpR family trp operon transcriptional repressor